MKKKLNLFEFLVDKMEKMLKLLLLNSPLDPISRIIRINNSLFIVLMLIQIFYYPLVISFGQRLSIEMVGVFTID